MAPNRRYASRGWPEAKVFALYLLTLRAAHFGASGASLFLSRGDHIAIIAIYARWPSFRHLFIRYFIKRRRRMRPHVGQLADDDKETAKYYDFCRHRSICFCRFTSACPADYLTLLKRGELCQA